MRTQAVFLLMAIVACLSLAHAFEASPLQDFCVYDLNSSVSVNGFACKDPKLAQESDFSFSGLHIAGNTSNKVGSKVTPVFATQMPGLNTLGISMVRIDYAAWGINPPHTHPRATEILTVLEGTLEVGFVTSNPDNRLITKVLYKVMYLFSQWDSFITKEMLATIMPWLLRHLAAKILALLPLQVQFLSRIQQYGSDLLAKAFQVDQNIVEKIKWNL